MVRGAKELDWEQLTRDIPGKPGKLNSNNLISSQRRPS